MFNFVLLRGWPVLHSINIWQTVIYLVKNSVYYYINTIFSKICSLRKCHFLRSYPIHVAIFFNLSLSLKMYVDIFWDFVLVYYNLETAFYRVIHFLVLWSNFFYTHLVHFTIDIDYIFMHLIKFLLLVPCLIFSISFLLSTFSSF